MIRAHLSAVRITVFAEPFLSGLEKSMLFGGALICFYQLEPVHIGEPGRIVTRFWRLASVLLDDSTADDCRDDLLVKEVSCLQQKAAYHKAVEGGGQRDIHDDCREKRSWPGENEG